MPFIGIPWAVATAIGSLAGAGAGIGQTIYNDVSQPGAPQQPAPPTAAQNITAEVQKRAAEANTVNQQIPGIEAQTSGGLSDQAYQNLGSSAAGIPGTFGQGGFDLNNLLSQLNGGGSGNPTNLLNLASGSSGGSITG